MARAGIVADHESGAAQHARQLKPVQHAAVLVQQHMPAQRARPAQFIRPRRAHHGNAAFTQRLRQRRVMRPAFFRMRCRAARNQEHETLWHTALAQKIIHLRRHPLRIGLWRMFHRNARRQQLQAERFQHRRRWRAALAHPHGIAEERVAVIAHAPGMLQVNDAVKRLHRKRAQQTAVHPPLPPFRARIGQHAVDIRATLHQLAIHRRGQQRDFRLRQIRPNIGQRAKRLHQIAKRPVLDDQNLAAFAQAAPDGQQRLAGTQRADKQPRQHQRKTAPMRRKKSQMGIERKKRHHHRHRRRTCPHTRRLCRIAPAPNQPERRRQPHQQANHARLTPHFQHNLMRV